MNTTILEAPTSSTTVSPIPEGMHTVTPHLICAGAADAIEFYTEAFDAVELMRLPGPDGKLMHARIQIGDSIIMLTDETPQWKAFGPKALKGSPVTIHLYVQDADELFEQAVGAGGTPTFPVTDMFWGDRYGVVQDPFGHNWSIATRVREVTDLQEAMKEMGDCCG